MDAKTTPQGVTIASVFTDIAHSVWIEGKPQNSITPAWLTAGPLTAIKALHDFGDHPENFIEDNDDRATYTLDDLREVVETLDKNYDGFQKYAAGIGLVSPNAA